ncbi:MAG: hypothetical protein QXO21_00870 [Candidatus Anstonellales archaeon]
MLPLEHSKPGTTYKIISEEPNRLFHYLKVTIKDKIDLLKETEILNEIDSIFDAFLYNGMSITYNNIYGVFILSKIDLKPIIAMKSKKNYMQPAVYKFYFYKAFLYTKQKEAILCYLFSCYERLFPIGSDIEYLKKQIENNKITFTDMDYADGSFAHPMYYESYLIPFQT